MFLDISVIQSGDSLSNDSQEEKNIISTVEFDTPLGPMLAGATGEGLCLLEFADRIRLEAEFLDLKKQLNAVMQPGPNSHLEQVQQELREYFDGTRKSFTVPLLTPGNAFSQSVWNTLREIPYGKTWSYKQQAEKMKSPNAIRAIATTNGRNRIAIIVPCHRVIGSNGSLTGYAAGIGKKRWLLDLERAHSEKEAGCLF